MYLKHPPTERQTKWYIHTGKINWQQPGTKYWWPATRRTNLKNMLKIKPFTETAHCVNSFI